MDKYKIDGHKLNYHLSRVTRWFNGETIYPIYMEISPSGMCNHRCTFCALDFMEYKRRFLDTDCMLERLAEMGRLGLKSVMFGGEGEPLLHKDIALLTKTAKDSGIDTAFTTNGVFLDEQKSETIIPYCEWIKVSINAGTAANYAGIHQTKPTDFDKVITNLRYAANHRNSIKSSCVLGMQILLLPENRHEIRTLAEVAANIGMDYLIVKPFSQHPASKSRKYQDIRYDDAETLRQDLSDCNTGTFKVIVRTNTMAKWNDRERGYSRCRALPFWSYIDSAGNVWGCSMYLNDDRFLYGNINHNSFQEIWEGDKRRLSLDWIEKEFNADSCRINCRMDKINQYLFDLKNPPRHINFI